MSIIHKTRIIICAAAFLLSAYFIWSNILLLDDSHSSHEEMLPTYITSDEIEDKSVQNSSTAMQHAVNSVQQPFALKAEQSGSVNNVPVKGYHIYINLDKMLIYVYKNGELIKTYPCSGGMINAPSPLGTWKIISKDTWGEGFGGAWLGLNVPWGKYGIHGTVYPWFIGKSNQSKGCIRMLNKDVKELYTMVPHGTTVTIVYENKPFRSMKSGDIGSDIKEIQQALKKLGYYNGYPDGKFGPVLEESVKKFQKDNKISVIGSVGRQTYSRIMEKLRLKDEAEQKQQQ